LDLKSLIRYAYRFEGERIVGGPDTLLRQNYIISATAVQGAVLEKDADRQMLKSLLADRFALKVRLESETRDGMVLRRERADRLGPNLIRRSIPCDGGLVERAFSNTTSVSTVPDAERCSIAMRNERMRGSVKDMAEFAGYLSVQAAKPVRDETGLEGSYSIDVTFDPATLLPFLRPTVSPYAAYPKVSEAFKDSLGLRLDTERTPGRVLVIEHVESPTEN